MNEQVERSKGLEVRGEGRKSERLDYVGPDFDIASFVI